MLGTRLQRDPPMKDHHSTHHARIVWDNPDDGLDYDRYSRDHDWLFGDGLRVAASAAPDFLGNPDRVDPEKAFVAAVASCHMLTALAICAKRGWVVSRYEDAAVGYLEADGEGRLAIVRVELRPRIRFAGEAPPPDRLDWLHERAHEACFIANSVRSEIVVKSE